MKTTNELDTILLGCSFTPEKYPDHNTVTEGLRFVLDTMKLRKIRFAIRWNKVLQEDGSYSLDYYKPFFEIFKEYTDLQLCLNIGPIKTTDWPEVHAPRHIIEQYSDIPHWPNDLPIDHDFTKEAGNYLHAVCRLLKNGLPTSVLDSITILQLNNEGFNPFGEDRIVMSIDSELYFESIASTYFPNRTILLNSAGRLQIKKILKTQSKLIGPSILGIDYYYHTPDNDYPVLRDIDVLDLPFIWTPTMRSAMKSLETSGNTLEITEAQMEKWGHITYPGESAEAFKKMLTRLSYLKPKHQESLLVRIWGVELFSEAFISGKQTAKMNELLTFIQSSKT